MGEKPGGKDKNQEKTKKWDRSKKEPLLKERLRYLCPLDGAVRGKHVAELVVGDGTGDVPDVELPRRHLRRRLEQRRGGGYPQRQPTAPGLRRRHCT